MVILTNVDTYENWSKLRMAIRGISFSINFNRLSLDENIGRMLISGHSALYCIDDYTEASKIVQLIGAKAFKEAIENTWNPEYFNTSTRESFDVVDRLLSGFIWERAPQGRAYWRDKHIKLKIGLNLE